jgi:hypothetical protein
VGVEAPLPQIFGYLHRYLYGLTLKVQRRVLLAHPLDAFVKHFIVYTQDFRLGFYKLDFLT